MSKKEDRFEEGTIYKVSILGSEFEEIETFFVKADIYKAEKGNVNFYLLNPGSIKPTPVYYLSLPDNYIVTVSLFDLESSSDAYVFYPNEEDNNEEDVEDIEEDLN